MIYLLDFRGANTGGAVVPGRIVRYSGVQVPLGTEAGLEQESRVTFLLHGYNVNRQEGITALLNLAGKLPSAQAGAIVAVLWPGDHWTHALSYPFEGRDADDSAVELARFIERVLRPGAEISFVSHSLGARVVMETIRRLPGRTYVCRQICLMAAAIDDDSLAAPDRYRDAVEAAERVAVLASKGDWVLKYAYPAGDLIETFLFWPERVRLALGYHGPRPYREYPVPGRVRHQQIPDDRKADHGDYIPAANPTPNQLAAARFADQVLQGEVAPQYSP